MNKPNYPAATSFLGKMVTAVIDRPMHSQHPEWQFVYPLNYGYLPGVPAPDGDELDVYVLNVNNPLQTFTGECVAVIHRLNDADDKLIVVPPGEIVTDTEIRAQTHFQEQFFDSIIIR
ncbi:inorganic diphosphatase [Candidatus Leptofilum sp.]|uniref:inorganic diphosphatase n=1 Tax=Candidatus Leptofilum sp. TaxID=3241576 RepID=UPI003B5BC183